MSKLSVAIAVLLVPTLGTAVREDPVAPGPALSEAIRANAPPFAATLWTEHHVCVPFIANGNPGSVQITGGPPPAPLTITLSAGGQATHLGRYSSMASFVVTFLSPTAAVFDGGGTFVAANGDELVFEFSGDFFPGPVAGGHGLYEFVSGTGRFEGATGSGVFNSEDGHTTFDGAVCLAR